MNARMQLEAFIYDPTKLPVDTCDDDCCALAVLRSKEASTDLSDKGESSAREL
jgi:hypothetical protein